MIAVTANSEVRPAPNASRQQLPGRVLMKVNGLRRAFGGHVVLDGVDLELREGEIILLRGENGSGKTTLLNILTGNMEPDVGEIQLFVNSHAERFRFPRRWWQELNPWDHFTPERIATEGVGRTWQDIRLFGSQTLKDNLAVARPGQPGEKPWRIVASPSCWKKAEMENQQAVKGILQTLGLGGRGDSSADMISLGQTKRIAFARSTHSNTKIIFLDEPLAGLDQEGAGNVIAILRDLAAAHRLTLVIVEHLFNIPAILDFATAVWTLADGHITLETVADAENDPFVRNASALPGLIRKISAGDAVITEEPLPRGAVLTRVSRPGVLREPLMTIKELVAHRGRRLVVGDEKNGVVKGFDLTVHKGELVLLQAPNGWGKTSLLEALAGILPCTAGSIQLDGLPLERQPTWERCLAGLTVVPARDNVFSRLSVAEYKRITGSKGRQTEKRKGFSLHRRVSSLSSGERKRLVIENANRQDSKVRVWDEPFGSLDGNGLHEVLQYIMPSSACGSLVLVPSSLAKADA